MPDPSVEAKRILGLARTDRSAARAAVARLDPDVQVALVCESPLASRATLLGLVSEPERVIPRIPAAELCFVVKAVGLPDAGWLLEHATSEQITAAVDLDAWEALVPDRGRIAAWLAAFADAGEETLLRAAHALDFEVLVLELRARLSVQVVGRDEVPELPPGAQTLDGQFYVIPSRSGDDLEDVVPLLRALFQHDYWFYQRLLQAVGAEFDADLEEWALRWRNGRLQDLGFPPLEDAKRIYARLPPDQLGRLAPEEHPLEVGEWPLPVWMPSLPLSGDADGLLFRAMAGLVEDERRPVLLAFLALANRVAVADSLPLGDAESLPSAIAKAARIASRGLAHLSAANRVEPADVLRRATLERLFNVGANLERGA
jgi:hypothetical protein